MKAGNSGSTRDACVCWSISSDTRVRYALGRPRRQAYIRRRGSYQSHTATRADGGRLGSTGLEALRDVMTTLLVTVAENAMVAEAAQVMIVEHVGAALIVVGEHLRWILTE